MFRQPILSCEGRLQYPLLANSGASRKKHASVQCRGLHGQHEAQDKWSLKLASAGVGAAALASLALASPAGRNSNQSWLVVMVIFTFKATRVVSSFPKVVHIILEQAHDSKRSRAEGMQG